MVLCILDKSGGESNSSLSPSDRGGAPPTSPLKRPHPPPLLGSGQSSGGAGPPIVTIAPTQSFLNPAPATESSPTPTVSRQGGGCRP